MRLAVVTVCLLATITLFAQEQKEEKDFKTIFSKDFSSGGYGGPELKLSNINDDMSLLVGGRGGWIINHSFVIGGAGYGLTTNNRFDYTEDISGIDSTRKLRLDMGYGGLLLEYIAFPREAIHLSFPFVIGAGGASVSTKEEGVNPDANNWDNDPFYNWNSLESTAFFVLEPGINIELNLIKYLRLNLGASYRYISATDLDRLTDDNFSDFSFNLCLKFGKF